jgi:predicted dehydrogenase
MMMPSNHILTAAVVGLGERGANVYGAYPSTHQDQLKCVACAEPNALRRERFARQHGIPPERTFASDVDFFDARKVADVVFICTMDRQHERQAMNALRLGYHVLLEKPIAVTEEGTRQVVREAIRCQRVLCVGHVLRYSPLFSTVKKTIDAGTLGDLVSLRMSENMGTWVFAHSFVRGNWGNSARSSSLIVQKGCHDLDLLYWLVGSPPELISCTASPPLLTKEHMPPGAPPRCTDGCPHAAACLYEAVRFYRDGTPMMRDTARAENIFVKAIFRTAMRFPRLVKTLFPPARSFKIVPWRQWPVSQLGEDISDEGIMRALREGPYGRCVYQCDNDQPAACAASIRFANGVTATYTLHGMSYRDGRELRIDGTKASLTAVFYNTRFRIGIHDHATGKTRSVKLPIERSAGGGGDARIVQGFLDAVAGKAPSRTEASDALWSHLMCFAAERSIQSGETQRIEA